MKIIKKEHQPYGVIAVTAEVDGKTVTKRLKTGLTDAEIKKAFGESDTVKTESKKETKK